MAPAEQRAICRLNMANDMLDRTRPPEEGQGLVSGRERPLVDASTALDCAPPPRCNTLALPTRCYRALTTTVLLLFTLLLLSQSLSTDASEPSSERILVSLAASAETGLGNGTHSQRHHHHAHKLRHHADSAHRHSKRNSVPEVDAKSAKISEFSTVTPVASYVTSNKSINFTHIEVDPFTGTIYVGAVNWVFQLHPESLRVVHAVRTGPIRDSVFCAPADCSGVTDQNLVQVTNNINKVLLVEPYSRMLIVCGSVHQGACARHRLEDISTHEELVPIPVAANDENSSTIAFVVPARYYGVQLTPILYVAATDSRLGPYRDMVPAISGRSLESGSRLFNIIERTFADTARVDISSHLRDYFLVRYVYGFNAGDYIYFAHVQRRSYLRALEEWGYVSRLGRVCISDAGFHTYTELTLECVYEPSAAYQSANRRGHRYRRPLHRSGGGSSSETGDAEEFNLLQDAFLVKAGADLSDALNIERGGQVLIGVFSSSSDHTQRPGGKSAVCMFPVADIDQRFAENIHLCYNGSIYSRNMDYIAGSVNQCPEPGSGNVFNFCNEAVKLNGSLSLRAQAAIVYRDGTILRAVTAASTGQHTVAFLGTNYGSVKKVLLASGDYGEQFDEVVIDQNQPILSDIFVDAEQNPRHLIASSPYKVVKLPIETCGQHDTCDRCLEARNPYCGWCSLQKRCTIKSECSATSAGTGSLSPLATSHGYRHHHSSSSSSAASSIFSTPRWLSLETAQCIDFQAIKPEFMPRDLLAPVELIINQLPPLPYGANYLCVFEQSSPIPAKVTRHGLTCQTPSVVSRPAIPAGQDHMSVNLAVRSSETDTDFIHRSFVFFDCTVHKSCKSCVMSAWNCNWCMHENLCTYNTSTCTRRVIVGENSPQNSLIKGVQHCPSFNIDVPILVPNGARKELRVEVRNLIPSQDGFQCVVEIEQAKERVAARVQDNNIICSETTLSYQEEVGEQNASLTVLWNGDTFIDRTNVTLYKCQYLGAHTGRPDCSLCQTRDSRYRCVWCQNACTFVDQCGEVRPANSCPPPRIDYIHPISGPVEGGTLVSIEGSNLGASLDEIKDRLSIGGIPCTPIEYNVSIRVICRTGASITGAQSANVVIGNRAGVTRAQAKFQYKIIELNDVSPKIGPQSGGSRIYLSGKNLNIGSNVAVYLDDMPCTVERALASNSQLSCRTTAAPYPSYVVSRLLLIIDGSNYTLLNPFLYTADPTISRVEPLQSFFSGGRAVYVTGTQFTSIQQPRLVVMTRKTRNSSANRISNAWAYGAKGTDAVAVPTEATIAHLYNTRLVNDSICTVLSSVKMVCPSPMINGNLEMLAAKLRASTAGPTTAPGPVNIFPSSNYSINQIPDQLYLQIGFLMDDTISVLELDAYYQHMDSNMLYIADPVLYSISNGHGQSIPVGNGEEVLTVKTGDVLVIEGENLSILPLADTELNITIGPQRCNLTSVSMRQLVCSLPIYPPPPTDDLGRRGLLELPSVVLRIGNLRRHLGYLHYGDYYGFTSGSNGFSHRAEDVDPSGDTRFYHQNAFNNRFDHAGGNSATAYLNLELLIGILIVTGTILAVVSIIVLAAYKHKTNEAEREYKRIQLQMDTLENNVRSECKQAFAELQTDILQASGLFSVEELHRMNVPTHDERTFLLRMFFQASGSAAAEQLYAANGSIKDWYNSSIESAYYTYRYGSIVGCGGGIPRPVQGIFWKESSYFNPAAYPDGYLPSLDAVNITVNPYQAAAENFYTLNNRSNRNGTLKQSNGQAGAFPAPGTGTLSEQFLEQLFFNRHFVLTLVEVLESQRSFTAADRAHFASLLMLTLLDRMEYAFDVMRHLLARLIDRLAGAKNAAHLLMMKRASGGESVAEKMLIDWLSICMFKYAKEVSSGPLFLLYSAIKHQIDKGPVDYVTGMSRYSLSEDRLLREQIEYKTLTVYVSVDEKLQQTLPSPPSSTAQQSLSTNKSTIGCRTATSRKPSTIASTLGRRTRRTSGAVGGEDLPGGDEGVDTATGNCDKATDSDEPGSAGSGQQPNPGYLCRVLDCDTISQAKAKILDSLYRAVPHSERPSVAEVVLYWRCLKPKVQSAASTTTTQQPSTTSTGTATQNSNSSSCEAVIEPGNALAPAVAAAQAAAQAAAASLYTIQDIYGVASMMSKADADKIYNASRRSDMSLMEMTELPLDDYDHSTQILTANEAIWRRLNTISHYGIGDGAQLILCLRSATPRSGREADGSLPTSRLIYTKGFSPLSGAYPPPPPAPPGPPHQLALSSQELYEDDNSDLNADSNYHLYESIPAVYGGSNNRDSIYGVPGNTESVYNLSNASSSGLPSGRSRSVAHNYYHLGASTPAHRPSYPATYDLIGGGTRRAPSSLGQILGPEEMYGSPGLRYPIYSPSTLSPANYSHTRLLARNQSQLSHSRLSNSSAAHHYLATSSRRRSFARNFYDRLSSLVRPGSRSGTLRTSATYKYGATCNGARPYSHRGRQMTSDYEDGDPEMDELGGEEMEEMKHNIWHLVKPSSLIADCIIGATGSFLYDDPADGKSRRNIRTMRQRRAMRRRRRKNPFGLNSGSSRLSGGAKTQQLASAAAAALSASQINLNNVNIAPITPMSGANSPTSPLSLITSSASSFFASFFSSNGPASATSVLPKSIPEIYLTRLLSTKGTIQQYVDDFFGTIFTVNERLPIAVKWLFDFLDASAERNSLSESDTVQLWKSNSLIWRFWVTLLRSPELMFDVGSTVSVDVCLDVLATNLMDAAGCRVVAGSATAATPATAADPAVIYGGSLSQSSASRGHTKEAANSPPGKLLFARDIPAYRQMISQYYADIAMLPAINESDIIAYMKDVSKTYEGKVCKDRAISELITYCLNYKEAIFTALSSDAATQREHLHLKFETLIYAAAAGRAASGADQQQHQPNGGPYHSAGTGVSRV